VRVAGEKCGQRGLALGPEALQRARAGSGGGGGGGGSGVGSG